MSRIPVRKLPKEQDQALTAAIENENKYDWAAQNKHVPLAFELNVTTTRDIYTQAIEEDWKVEYLPVVDGKLPSRLFLYWGYVNINNKSYDDVQGLIPLMGYGNDWILLARETRVLALYD